jgi:hypothetical protein
MFDVISISNQTLCNECINRLDNEIELTVGNLLVSKSCWSLFNEAVTSYFHYPDISRITLVKIVAAYGLQHPSKLSKQSIKSVYIHLMSLYLIRVEGLAEVELNQCINIRLEKLNILPWLEPPIYESQLSISHIMKANNLFDLQILVDEWASDVWQSWYRKYYYTIEDLMYS